jgi:serine/threonine-protein kinase
VPKPAIQNNVDIKPQIPNYMVRNMIGSGGMGQVYKAVRGNKQYALKVAFPQNEAALKREGIMAIITAGHPNLVSVEDMGQVEGKPFVVYELLHGEDVKQLMAYGEKFDLETTRIIIKEVAAALQHLHEVGVVHRDIKPENIVVRIESNDEGEIQVKRVILIDFGLMEVMTESKSQDGLVFGTKGHMSPEQILGEELDGRSDIFTLGITLLEMLTGVNPFLAASLFETCINVQEKAVPQDLIAPLPEYLQKIILKMLAKNRADRYQSCGQLIADLNKIM